ncbi:hypothetical protein PPYR_13912 [Photinus pyralis]|uniref:Uncharacterized protein n=2 Tax=Photinus pyralis TaxID=7054 RepID=A0A5N4A3S0_PHOPY|nr:uncharacterized protein LOC116180975 isoform X2 [Photinus pyralis]KAB0791951.1 hypothetical protein PPYR_13912 [Photinus pyralis]
MLRLSLLFTIYCSIDASFYHSEKPTLDALELWHCTTDAINDTCVQSSGADRDQVQLLWSDLMYSETRNLKCYLACMYKNVDFMNSHGELVGPTIVQENENLITMEEFELCDDVAKRIADQCEKTFEFSYCLTHTNHTNHK